MYDNEVECSATIKLTNIQTAAIAVTVNPASPLLKLKQAYPILFERIISQFV
jgi:hypothetical protein